MYNLQSVKPQSYVPKSRVAIKIMPSKTTVAHATQRYLGRSKREGVVRACEGNGEMEGRKVKEACCLATRCKNEVMKRCSVKVMGM